MRLSSYSLDGTVLRYNRTGAVFHCLQNMLTILLQIYEADSSALNVANLAYARSNSNVVCYDWRSEILVCPKDKSLTSV